MNTPSKADRLDFWKHSYARSSFIQAQMFITELLEKKLDEFSPERDLFTIAILGAYCRPFKQRHPVKLAKDIIPSEFFDLHDSLEEMRDKVIAHRDLDGPQAKWGFVSDLHICTDSTGFEINTISPRITDKKAQDMIPLLRFLITKMNEGMNSFVKAFMPPLPLVPARYAVSLDENPSDWLVKQ